MKKLTCHSSPIHDKEFRLVVGDLNTRPSMRIDSRNRKVSKEIVPKIIRSAHCLVKVFLSSSPVRDLGSDMTTTTFLSNIFHGDQGILSYQTSCPRKCWFLLWCLSSWDLDIARGQWPMKKLTNRQETWQVGPTFFATVLRFLVLTLQMKGSQICIVLQDLINSPSITLHLPLLYRSKTFEDSCTELSWPKHINNVQKRTRCRHAIGNAEVVSNRQCPREPHSESHMVLVCTAMSVLSRESREINHYRKA